MPDLPALIVEAAKRGLDGFTLYPTSARWQASARFRGTDGWHVQIADTPTEAVVLALTPPMHAPTPQSEPTGVFD